MRDDEVTFDPTTCGALFGHLPSLFREVTALQFLCNRAGIRGAEREALISPFAEEEETKTRRPTLRYFVKLIMVTSADNSSPLKVSFCPVMFKLMNELRGAVHCGKELPVS